MTFVPAVPIADTAASVVIFGCAAAVTLAAVPETLPVTSPVKSPVTLPVTLPVTPALATIVPINVAPFNPALLVSNVLTEPANELIETS